MVEQPDINAAEIKPRINCFGYLTMWTLTAEMLLALGIIVFIFWWTMRARIDHPVETQEVDEALANKEDSDTRGVVKRDSESS